MAGFQMFGDPSDLQVSRAMRRFMSPHSVAQSIDSILAMLWTTLPTTDRRMMSLESAARLLFADVISAWRATDPADRARQLGEDAKALMKNPPAGEADATEPLDETSTPEESEFQRFFRPEMVRHQLGQAIYLAHVFLPEGQKNDVAVETYVRHVLERTLAAWWEDARTLDLGVE